MSRLILYSLRDSLPGYHPVPVHRGAVTMGEFVLFFVSLFSIVNPLSGEIFPGWTGIAAAAREAGIAV